MVKSMLKAAAIGMAFGSLIAFYGQLVLDKGVATLYEKSMIVLMIALIFAVCSLKRN